ncbi:hypothetical protein LPJ59_000089 [Coemansia sp. RSA 2399]|nr:hypothetical protein LPJ59_000089 [Coemansia sp. RSA 2399]
MYYRSRNIDFTKEYPEAAKNDAKDSKFMVKAVFDGAKKRASSQATWSTDEVARLREARGDRNERRGTKASEGQPLLRKLVSDSGGAEKADWEAISKEIGVTALQCQRTYHKMTVAKSSSKLWSPDEFDRLLTNLRSQHIHGGAYDWDLAAAAVGTRTSKQCWGRFHYDQKTSRHHLYDFDSSQE